MPTLILSLVWILIFLIPSGAAQVKSKMETSIFQCRINASADRSFDEQNGWVGHLPRSGEKSAPSVPFDIGVGGTEEGYVFTHLDTGNPRIRPVMAWNKQKTNTRELGVEKSGKVFRRAESAIFFQWEFGPNEFYTAVLDTASKKLAVSQVSTCRGQLCAVGVKAITADCQSSGES